MQKLLNGIVKFREEDFEAHRELFSGLKNKQSPHTLFITCSDSRVDPNMITKTLPGELFIIRNIANVVAPYCESEEYKSTTSGIEYAVVALEVENIIVCGHSNCGGCAASLYQKHNLDHLTHTKKWLELIEPVRDRIINMKEMNEPVECELMMEQENVLEQLNHLLTYPYIKEGVLSGKLNISGWHYIIETGEVFIYDKESAKFQLANKLGK